MNALRETCDPYVSFVVPAGGFFFWLRLADGLDATEVTAAAAERGVAVTAGEHVLRRRWGRRPRAAGVLGAAAGAAVRSGRTPRQGLRRGSRASVAPRLEFATSRNGEASAARLTYARPA